MNVVAPFSVIRRFVPLLCHFCANSSEKRFLRHDFIIIKLKWNFKEKDLASRGGFLVLALFIHAFQEFPCPYIQRFGDAEEHFQCGIFLSTFQS